MDHILTALKVLADETRFKLIHLLLKQQLCGKALAGRLGISEAAVSQHPKVLKETGLLQGEKRGYWIHYSVKGEMLEEIIEELERLARPESGAVRIAGIDCTDHPKAAQHLIGVVPDESNLYPELTGFENLCFCATLYGMRKGEREAHAYELLEIFGLAKAAERKFGGYSRGMKRKLTIAAALFTTHPSSFSTSRQQASTWRAPGRSASLSPDSITRVRPFP